MPTSTSYRGLVPFEEENSAVFCGREEEVERNIERLLVNQFLAVIGPSGIGKSSLVQAGIIPRLRAKHREVQPIVVCHFGGGPIANLTTTVSEISGSEASPASRWHGQRKPWAPSLVKRRGTGNGVVRPSTPGSDTKT